MSQPTQNTPYLRSQRKFPVDSLQALQVEIDKSYVDVAQKVNARTIGIFPVNTNVVTGESWYLTGVKQQTLRQVYTITGTGNIAHGLTLSQLSGFTRIYGTFTDGTNWFPLPYVDVVAANNQVNIVITGTNIVITAGGGSPPAVVSGWVVLEWLTNRVIEQ